MNAATDSRARRPRRGGVMALIVIGSLVGVLAVFSLWVAREILETDTWTENSTELLEQDDIREPVAGFLADALFTDVDIETEIANSLPPQAQGLAGPAAGGLRQLTEEAADRALQRPRIQELWEQANARAHAAFVQVVKGEGNAVQVGGGVVTLDLGALLDEVASQVGIDLSGKIPPDAGQIVILESGELSTVQDILNALRPLAIALTLATFVLFGLAIYLAQGWRREALRTVGFAFIIIGILILAVRGFAGDYLPGELASTASTEDAVSSVWEIYTSLLKASAWSVVGYGVVMVLGAWVAGPGPVAVSIRRELASLLHSRGVAYAVLGVLLLLLFWWNPTPGTARLLSSLLLIVLLVIGMEALRRQAIVDFPDETLDTAADRWRKRLSRSPAGQG